MNHLDGKGDVPLLNLVCETCGRTLLAPYALDIAREGDTFWHAPAVENSESGIPVRTIPPSERRRCGRLVPRDALAVTRVPKARA